MKISPHFQTWILVMAMLIGASIAYNSDPQISVLSAGSSSPSHGEGYMSRDHEQPAVQHSLKTIAMRVFSFEGGVQTLHWPKLEWSWRLVLAVILGSLGASLCSAGGVGGGGLFIPLFNLLLQFDAKSAAALSNFMILGGSIANVGWNFRQEHPHHAGHPLVDFDVALLLQPNMLLGISLGVICNVVFPSWFIILEFVITLGYITRRSFISGLLRWKTLDTYSAVDVVVQLTAATTAFMVFFSSSLSVIQYWLLGRLPVDFAILFAVICFIFSLVGLRVVQHAITKFGRCSVIVFAVSSVLGLSAILTTIFGGLEVYEQYTRGDYMGFHKPC